MSTIPNRWQYRMRLTILVAACLLLPAPGAPAKTLQVGPGKSFAAPCAAIARAKAGDVIEIDSSGEYRGDVCGWTTNRLTIRGLGPGRARIDAGGQNAQGKGIWVISGNDTTIENIEFTGAAVADENGAAIRQEGANLTVRNCYFHHNEEGILAGDSAQSSILIEFSEFALNGSGDGRTHNIYINHISKFTLQFSYSHHANVGHLVKSRAAENYILYNRLTDEAGGTASYEIDLPNGGTSYVIGNVIEQGAETQNSTILAYELEGPDPRNPNAKLFILNNTFVNDRREGAIFVQVRNALPAVVQNNIFSGGGSVTNQLSAKLVSNFVGTNPRFKNPAAFDFSLTPNSPARNASTKPADPSDSNLTVKFQYLHPACGQSRSVPVKDIGALGFDEKGDPVGPERCRQAAP